MYLEATGNYEVRAENKGTAALEAAKQFQPDLILLDIILPDVDGTTIAAQIKDDPELSKTHIVFLTATVSREEVGTEGQLMHGDRVLAKPTNPTSLVECIEETLR